MKALNSIKILASLLVAGTALSACLNNGLPETQPADTFTMRVDAKKGPGTRALVDAGTTLSATWNLEDVVDVYKGTEKVGTLSPDKAAATATLSGVVRGVAEGDELTLAFGTPDNYATQDGTLEYIDANCNYAEATIQVTGIEDNVVSTTAAAFENAQSITKFTFSKTLQSVTISGGATDIEVTLDTPGTDAYVAMPGTTEKKTYTFIAHDEEGILMRGTKSATLANGKFYTASVRLVSGGVELSFVNPWRTSGELTYDIPEGVKIKNATLVINVYSGSATPTYGAMCHVLIQHDDGDDDLADSLTCDDGSTDGTVYTVLSNITKCYSDYQIIYDLTNSMQDQDGTTVKIMVETLRKEGYNFDGRIKLIALVVVYDGGDDDSFTYWLDTTQRWTKESNTLTFNTSSFEGLLRKARLFNISTSSAIGNYQLNGELLHDPKNLWFGDYFGCLEWDITDMIVEGEDTVLSSQPSDGSSWNSLKDVLTLLIYEKE